VFVNFLFTRLKTAQVSGFKFSPFIPIKQSWQKKIKELFSQSSSAHHQ